MQRLEAQLPAERRSEVGVRTKVARLDASAVGFEANAKTTATPRSSASDSCLRSSASKMPWPRASAAVVACTEKLASRSSPASIMRKSE